MKEKPKNKPSKWMIRLGIFLLIAVAGCGILFIYIAGSVTEAMFTPEIADLQGEAAREFIESEPLGIPLPDDAQDIYVYYDEGIDFKENIRFSARPESVEAWLNGHDFCFTSLRENEPAYFFRTEENLSWWQANQASRYAVAQQCGDNPYYELVIDQSNPDLWIVYLLIFST